MEECKGPTTELEELKQFLEIPASKEKHVQRPRREQEPGGQYGGYADKECQHGRALM